MRYMVELLHITGRYTTGKYAHTGTMSFYKRDSLISAKETVSEEMKRGYYNYASIYDCEEDVTIERFVGQDWKVVA